MAEAVAKKSTGTLSKPSAAATRARAARPAKIGQIVVLLLLLVCFAASLYFFKQTMDAVSRSEDTPDAPPPVASAEVEKESEEVDKLGSDLSGMTMSTSLAMQTANMAEQIGILPVASSATLSPPPPPPQPLPPDEIFFPPEVSVKAVMITDTDSVAIVDIAGEESGLLVRRGSKFSDGTARITKIDSKGVTYTWMKKSYLAAVER
ncbi:MAG: hypothetical protein LBL73_07515 [Synergistaceae bacterium]|jgi:hypothetical protein|nr:hypothetical protein [Synergistaceae bacterium]